jgi:hypothetical protein
MGPHEPSSIGKGYWTFVQGPGFEPGMPTYSPLRGEFLAVRLPDKKKYDPNKKFDTRKFINK